MMKKNISWSYRLKASFIVCISIIISFFILEYSYRYIQSNDSNKGFINRTMLFEAGNNFENYEGYFKYFPNSKIRSLTIYSKSNPKSIKDLVVEYDYLIETNNMGLVMKNDLFFNESVVLVIGDSFTEGQGATPWFYSLEDSFNSSKVKIVNLGILGTGPKQWENLALSITKKLRLDVKGSVINIVPGDMVRGVWTLKERELNCLYKILCDYNYGFQGYKFKSKESYKDIKISFLNKFKNEIEFKSNSLLTNLYDFAKKSYIITHIYKNLRYRISDDKKINKDALLTLSKAVNGNLFANIVSLKTINSKNYKDHEQTKELIDFLEKQNIKYSWCDIPINGFHKYDAHPNSSGYKILKSCNEYALEKLNLKM